MKALTGFLSGATKLVMSGGTAGWGDLISSVKDGVSQAINAKIKEEKAESYRVFLNLENVKFQILKLIAEKGENVDREKRDNQIKQILIDAQRFIDERNKWTYKYYFVEILSEFVLYQPTIESGELEELLQKFEVTYDSIEQVWAEMVKQDWIIQFDSGEQQLGVFQRIGQIKPNRNPEFELPGVEQQSKEPIEKKKKKKGKKNIDLEEKEEEKLKTEPAQDEEEYPNIFCKMFSSYDKDLKEIRKFIIEGQQPQFKGILSYAFEGLEEEPQQDQGAQGSGQVVTDM